MPENLFFLAVLPPVTLRTRISKIQEDAAIRYLSGHALKSPPHITLIPPFWFDRYKVDDLVESLQSFVRGHASTSIELKNYKCFKPRVIYIDILDETGGLANLQRDLKVFLKEDWMLNPDKRTRYKPHCTIAFKDLSQTMFYKAWDYYKQQSFQATFSVESIWLLKHQEGRWQVLKSVPF